MFLWLQSDLQHFCPVDHSLEAGCGNGLPRDSVDLVEGVGFQDPLIGCTNEDLEPEGICTLVPVELVRAKKNDQYETCPVKLSSKIGTGIGI